MGYKGANAPMMHTANPIHKISSHLIATGYESVINIPTSSPSFKMPKCCCIRQITTPKTSPITAPEMEIKNPSI